MFRAQGHGVVVQDACAARLRDAFIEDPNPKRALPCRPDTAPNFTAAWERVRNMPKLNEAKDRHERKEG